jgi:hypothetical protein
VESTATGGAVGDVRGRRGGDVRGRVGRLERDAAEQCGCVGAGRDRAHLRQVEPLTAERDESRGRGIVRVHARGRVYHGERLRPESIRFSKDSVAADFIGWLHGQTLTAYFDAAEPERAVLVPTVGVRTAASLFIGALMFCGGTLMMVTRAPRVRLLSWGLPVATRHRRGGFGMRPSVRQDARDSLHFLGIVAFFVGAVGTLILWTYRSFNPEVPAGLSDIMIAVAAAGPLMLAGAALVVVTRMYRPGVRHLVIDLERWELRVLWQKEQRDAPREVVPLASIMGVSLDRVADGDNDSAALYTPVFFVRDRRPDRMALYGFEWEIDDAEEWLDWMRAMLVRGVLRKY